LHTTKVATFYAYSGAAGAQRWCSQWDSDGWGGLVSNLLAFENGGGFYGFPHLMGLFDRSRSVS